MGGDGGSLNNSRHELVAMRHIVMGRKGNDSMTKSMQRREAWTRCALSQKLLRPPVVICRRGYLMRKEELLLHLLERRRGGRRESNDIVGHVRSHKDVVEIDTEWVDLNEKETDPVCVFRCSLTGKEGSGAHRFVVCSPCGCVMFRGAINELGAGNAKECPKCGRAIAEQIAINPDDRERWLPRESNLTTSLSRKRKRSTVERESKQKPSTEVVNEKRDERQGQSDVYSSLFIPQSERQDKTRVGPRGSFTGVSLRPAGN